MARTEDKRGGRARIARESGFALPTVMFMLLAAFTAATTAAVVSMSAQRGTLRDADSKQALALAEAGVSEALLHYNRVITSGTSSCVVSSGSSIGVAPPSGGWCSPVSGSAPQGEYTYSVAPTPGHLEIVSTGDSNGVTRRIQVSADSVSGQGVFSTATVKSRSTITLDSNSEIRANAATNGDMFLNGNSKLCGTGSVGVGRAFTLATNARHNADQTCTGTGTLTRKPLTLPAVNQGDAATVNDNSRFFGSDLRTGGSRVSWNASTRTLNLSSNSAVTLGGSVYSLCRLTMSSNTSLYIAPGAAVTIYFDSPEACGLAPNTKQIDLSSNSRITSSGGGPTRVAILMVGSDTIPTKVQLSSNTQVAGACEQNFVIYAPRTDVDFNSNSTYCGALAAKTIHMDANTKVYNDAGARNFVLPNTAPHYEPSAFVECSSKAASPPDSGC
jgi:hypothetical protein